MNVGVSVVGGGGGVISFVSVCGWSVRLVRGAWDNVASVTITAPEKETEKDAGPEEPLPPFDLPAYPTDDQFADPFRPASLLALAHVFASRKAGDFVATR